MAFDAPTIAETLRRQGISRRGFLKFCATTASLMALPPSMVPAIAAAPAAVSLSMSRLLTPAMVE